MKVGFPLEWSPDVVYLVAVLAVELNDCEEKIIWLVQGIENFITRDGDGRRTCDPALNIGEPQPASAGHVAFDVITELVGFAIDRLKAKAVLDLHDDLASPRRCGQGIHDRALD